MYIVVCNDDLGGYIECARCEDQGEAIDIKDELQIEDPYHTSRIMTDE